MHLTREADYALRIMHVLAKNGTLTDAQTISDSIVVTRRFVLKILSKLTAAELTASKLGAGGGYYLMRDAKDITVAEVIEAIEGPITMNACLADGYTCERVDDCGDCVLHCMFEALNTQLKQKLSRISVGDTVDITPSEMFEKLKA